MKGCKPRATPMENRLKLSKNNTDPPVDATKCRSLVGSLRYLVNTRPDLAFAVGKVSRYMDSPTTQHVTALKHILRYVAGTIGFGCCYKEDGDQTLIGYSDHLGVTGIAFFLGKGLITWASQKQKIVAQSSCEAEYIAEAYAASEGVWLSGLLADLKKEGPVVAKLKVDNKSAIALSKNQFSMTEAKEGRIIIEYVPTEKQLADILTKSLGRLKFVEMREKIGVLEVNPENVL
ncbi:secreted RxLR effector protein 161-like [Aegilops tauschii subsp. strangulata]|uniref:secreted RxLR effector protein 161-like n=1 Tax=Aegilops tauschii subsp. strangulata TaxID=200361 RepID=UPI001ABCE402|nr:secreted RxLR effector protein 161-like [Aegilops tauschii subsp. strangulata]